MAVTPFGFSVRSSGALTAGLTPTWSALYKLSDGSSVASPDTVAPITALGGGLYKVAYDPESANGELFGVIDATATITSASERYIEMCLAADSSRATRLDATISSRASQASLDTVDDFLDTEIAAIKAKTDNLPASPAAVGSAMTLANNAVTAASLASDAVAEIAGAASATLLRGPFTVYLDGPEGALVAGDVLYVGELPTIQLRVLDKDKSPVVLPATVTAKLTRTDTGGAVGDELTCTIRDAALGIVSVALTSAATDASLAGKRLQLTLAWESAGRLVVAGALGLEIKAR